MLAKGIVKRRLRWEKKAASGRTRGRHEKRRPGLGLTMAFLPGLSHGLSHST